MKPGGHPQPRALAGWAALDNSRGGALPEKDSNFKGGNAPGPRAYVVDYSAMSEELAHGGGDSGDPCIRIGNAHPPRLTHCAGDVRCGVENWRAR